MKEKICIGIGAAGGLLAAALGGWDLGLQVLLGFMAADLGTGLLTAGVFHNSPHTKDGRLDSRCCFQGICRKAEMLVLSGRQTRQTYCWTVTSCEVQSSLASVPAKPSRLRKTPDAWAFPCRQRGKMLSVC